MPNGDKVKAATKHGPSVAEKRQAIAAAKKKAFNANRRLEAAHRVSRNFEDATRLTEHEQAMLEQKQKREAKAAKAAQFRAFADAVAQEQHWPEEPEIEQSLTPRCSAAHLERITKHTVLVRQPLAQPKQEDLSKQVEALMIRREHALEKLRSSHGKPAENPCDLEQQEDDDELDSLLHTLVQKGILSEAQLDAITDEIAMGKVNVYQYLHSMMQRVPLKAGTP